MFPVLAWFYVRLARTEEREVSAQFGQAWAAYAARTPGFIPRRRPPDTAQPGQKQAQQRDSTLHQ